MDETAESLTEEQFDNSNLRFFGNGASFFGIVILNVILTVLTLGLYYPWAKASTRKYLWNEIEFQGSRFTFHGTGREMLKGWLIVYAFIITFYVALFLSTFTEYGFAILAIVYLAFFLLLPFAIFGTWKYRVSRTSWRGIHFTFDGNLKYFISMYYGQLLLTVLTLGIYGSWMQVKVQKYLFSNTSIGHLKMDFRGDGMNLFGINLLGIFLSIITLYLYLPVFIKNRFNFTIDHTTLQDEEKRIFFRSTLSSGEAFGTMIGNMFMLIFTAGLAFPWTFMRTMRMFFNNIDIPMQFDYDNLTQSKESYKDATGEELSDAFDIDLGF